MNEIKSVVHFGLNYFNRVNYINVPERDYIIFLHGYMSCPSTFKSIVECFKSDFNIICLNLATLTSSVDVLAQELELVIKNRGIEKYSLIGHSLGGIIAMQHQIFHAKYKAKNTICIASPFSGSKFAAFAIGPMHRELRTHSETLRVIKSNLNDLDNILIITAEQDFLIHGYNWPKATSIPNVGHLSVLTHPLTLQVVADLIHFPRFN